MKGLRCAFWNPPKVRVGCSLLSSVPIGSWMVNPDSGGRSGDIHHVFFYRRGLMTSSGEPTAKLVIWRHSIAYQFIPHTHELTISLELLCVLFVSDGTTCKW